MNNNQTKFNKKEQIMTTNETQITNNNNIDFLNEKLWIMVFYLHRLPNIKRNFIDRFIVGTWNRWWKNDKVDDDMVNWVKEHRSLDIDIVKDRLNRSRDKKPTPKWVKKLASQKGYIVMKSATSKHPLRVSGYSVRSAKNPKHIIAGAKFDLTFNQMLQIIQGGNK